MAELSNYEIAVRKDFADFVAAQALPEWVFVEVENMPICARMPLQRIWYANERMKLSIILIFCLSFIRLFCSCIIIGVRGIEKTKQIVLWGI